MSFRTFSRSLIAFAVVALSSYVIEVRLHSEGIPSRYLIVVSNFLVGLIAAALLNALSIREKQRQEYIECRLRVIAEMNHHIRNALQVITFYTRKGEKQEVSVREAVERIQWALREVLPQLPESISAGDSTANVVPFESRQFQNSRG